MGFETNTYLGPYIKVKVEKRKYTDVIPTCPKAECKNHDSYMSEVKYCSLCGSAIQDLEREFDGPRFNLANLCVELGEGIYVASNELDGYSYLLPNQHRKPPRRMSIYPQSESDTVIEGINQDAEIEWFKNAFKEEIHYVNQECGADLVAINWGFVLSHH